MRRSKLYLIIALAFAAVLVGALLILNFTVPQEEIPDPPAASASQSEQTPWVAGGDVITRIG